MGRLTCAAAVASLFLTCVIPTRSVAAGPRQVTVAMGYFANVQFTPYYVAEARGYYRQEGLNVTFRYGISPDLLKLASLGKLDFVNAGGDEVLTAGANGLRVKYIMTQYSRFPAAVFSLQSTGIRDAAELRGHSIGVPFTFGVNYVGLLALLRRAHVPPSSVSIKSINFTQVEAIAHRKVDAAVGYAMNEPVQLRQQGYRVREIDIFRSANIAGAGIAAGDGEIARDPAAVRGFVRATLRGMAYTLRDPDSAFRIAEGAVPEIKVQARVQRAVLQRCIDFWRPEPGHALGWVDPAVWKSTAPLLYRFKQIPRPVSPALYYTNQFVQAR